MVDYQGKILGESVPMNATVLQNMPVPRVWRVWPWRLLVALGLAILATSPAAVPPAAADAGADAVAQLLRGIRDPAAAAPSTSTAKADLAEIIQQLGEVQVAAQKCDAFLARFGDRPAVAAALHRIETKPGRGLFTSPETISELERIVKKPIDLGQRDLELCVQLRDRGVGNAPKTGKPASFSVIETRLGKCVSKLRGIGPRPAVVTQLRRLSRDIGDATFTSQARLTALENAAGRDLGLTVRELETCVDAYDTKTALIALTSVGVSLGSADACPSPPDELCQGTVPGQICCSGTFNICAQSCDEDGDCLPYCEPCFPSDATVSAEDGSSKRMTDLKIGDRVAVIRPDGSRGFDDIYLFTHKDGVPSAPYVTLTLESGRKSELVAQALHPGRDRARRAAGKLACSRAATRSASAMWSGSRGRTARPRPRRSSRSPMRSGPACTIR